MWQIQILSVSGWIPLNENGETFDVKEEALEDLLDFLRDTHEAWKEGYMCEPYDPNELRIVYIDEDATE